MPNVISTYLCPVAPKMIIKMPAGSATESRIAAKRQRRIDFFRLFACFIAIPRYYDTTESPKRKVKKQNGKKFFKFDEETP